MKPIYNCILLAVLLAACSHDKDSPAPASGTKVFVPPTVEPSQSGIIQLSQKSVTLTVGQTVSLSATLYHADGTIEATQPSFIWQSDHADIATVSNGQISGVSEGYALMTVTDGTHGTQSVSITVVSSSTSISTSASDIVFTPPVLVLPKQGTGHFNFTAKDPNGNTVSVSPTFIAGDALTVSGNAVTAENTTGTFNVYAATSNDTLNGFLKVIVYDPDTTQETTSYKITNLINYPLNFYKDNITALPFRIEVTQTTVTKGEATVSIFQTAPESITIGHTGVVTMANNGGFQSVSSGNTTVNISYKGDVLGAGMSVIFNPTGTWTNGKWQFCYPDYGSPLIDYDQGTYHFDLLGAHSLRCAYNGCNTTGDWTGGTGFLGLGTFHYLNVFMHWGELGPLAPNSQVWSGGSTYIIDCPGGSAQLGPGLYVNENTVKMQINGKEVSLVRGNTICGSTTTDTSGGESSGSNYITFNGVTYSALSACCTSFPHMEDPANPGTGDPGGFDIALANVAVDCSNDELPNGFQHAFAFTVWASSFNATPSIQENVTYAIPSQLTCDNGACTAQGQYVTPDSDYAFTGGSYSRSGDVLTITGTMKSYDGDNLSGTAIPFTAKIKLTGCY